jgi:hypothetical protein
MALLHWGNALTLIATTPFVILFTFDGFCMTILLNFIYSGIFIWWATSYVLLAAATYVALVLLPGTEGSFRKRSSIDRQYASYVDSCCIRREGHH